MKTNKIGSLFLVSVLALAGIGISYAGFTDTLSIYGTVDTATVTWEVVDYSGTEVYKVPDNTEFPNEIFYWHGFADAWEVQLLPGNAIYVASSWASEYTGGPIGDFDPDVLLTWDNIFPCQDFKVDIVIQYTGSIPAKINSGNIWTIDYNPNVDEDQSAWLQQLWTTVDPISGPAVTYGAYRCDANGYYDPQAPVPVTLGTQLHTGDYIYVYLTIHLPQDNYWQGCYGEFGASVDIVQWNEYPYTMPV